MLKLHTWEDLQQLLKVSEAPDLDFKEALDPDAPRFGVEARKDIAALANTLGGHIVIGASTDQNRSRCTGFHGVPSELAGRLGTLLEAQGKQGCRPTPMLSTRVIDVPEKPTKVLLLGVGMSPVAPIGASLKQDVGGHLVDVGWCFPYRVGSQTEYLTPDQFGAYEFMSARRAAALLNGIPQDELEKISLRLDHPTTRGLTKLARLVGISLVENTAAFCLNHRDTLIRVPLDDVGPVWRGVENRWNVVLAGTLAPLPGGVDLVYWPSFSGGRY